VKGKHRRTHPLVSHRKPPTRRGRYRVAVIAIMVSGLIGITVPALASIRYQIRSGDTLSAISDRFCGTPGDYPGIAAASGVRNPDLIYADNFLTIRCSRNGSISSSGNPGYRAIYSYSGLMALWRYEGGASWAAATAACIAWHESSGRTWVISWTDDWGLWQIHDGGYAMLNPYANARRAIYMSANGRNWSPWTTHWMCGV